MKHPFPRDRQKSAQFASNHSQPTSMKIDIVHVPSSPFVSLILRRFGLIDVKVIPDNLSLDVLYFY